MVFLIPPAALPGELGVFSLIVSLPSLGSVASPSPGRDVMSSVSAL